jgi:uroporphyrinogen III methyltransferase/synthase
MPTEHVAEALVAQGGAEGWAGTRVLFARAAEGREVIPEGLRKRGARVDVVAVYRNVPPPLSAEQFRKVLRGGADAITFTSGSTVQNFAALFPAGEAARLLEGVAVGCIGPVTADAARGLGLEVAVMPEEYTIAAFTTALERYFEKRQ